MRLFIFSLITFCIGYSAHAAVLSVSPRAITTGGENLVDVRIDTEGQSINALEMTIALPESDAVLNEAREGKSVVSFWTGSPTITGNSVTLSGIIPGGFLGEGVVTTLNISGVRAGDVRLSISDVSVLLNDGSGTAVPVSIADTTLSISDTEATTPAQDTVPPEPFTVSVISDPSIENGVYVAVFAAQDKQTGIKKYEIQETRLHTPEEGAWSEAVSPYVLSDQTLASTIFVRATDYAGNSRVARYEIPRGISVLEGALYLMVSLIAVLFSFALYVRHGHRKRLGLQ